MRRGQAALEFITTYGWAIVGLLVVVGLLSYFGLFSPSQYTRESCQFGAQLICEDFTIERVAEDRTQISMQLRNNFERKVEITQIASLNDAHTVTGCTSDIEIEVRQSMVVRCIVDANLEAGRKVPVPLAITFKSSEAGSPEHNIVGEVFAKIPTDIRDSPLLQCSDELDNDGDICSDMADTGCTSPEDPTESGGDCAGDPAAELDCFISSACPSPAYTTVLRLSDYTDAHAEQPGSANFNRYACCRSATDTLSNSCVAPDAIPLRLSNFTDAHAAQAGFPYDVCLSSTTAARTVACEHRASCTASQECLVKLAADGHVSDCTTSFPTSVCCDIL